MIASTLINSFDKRFDISSLSKNKRRAAKSGIADRINRDSSRIIASILQSAKSIEENLKNVTSLSVHSVIQVRKYPTHSLSRYLSRSLSLVLSLSRSLSLSLALLLAPRYISNRCLVIMIRERGVYIYRLLCVEWGENEGGRVF